MVKKILKFIKYQIATVYYFARSDFGAAYKHLSRLWPVYGFSSIYKHILMSGAIKLDRKKDTITISEHIIKHSRPGAINARTLSVGLSYIADSLPSDRLLDLCQSANSVYPGSKSIMLCYAESLYRSGVWGDAADAFRGVVKHYACSELYFRYAESCLHSKNLDEAHKAYSRAAELYGEECHHVVIGDTVEESHIYYRLGLVDEHRGNSGISQKNYYRAIEKDNLLDSKIYGVGVFHETYGLIDEAEREYRKTIKSSYNPKDIFFKIANMYERSREVERAISNAKKSLTNTPKDTDRHFMLARLFLYKGDLSASVENFKYAFGYVESHKRPSISIARLEYAADISAEGRYSEAIEVYVEVMSRYYDSKYSVDPHTRYAAYRQSLDIEKSVVLYESLGGARIMGNLYAIFSYLIKLKNKSELKHVWVINDPDNIPRWMYSLKNVEYVRKNSDKYCRYLATAEYLLCNAAFSDYFIRRSGQKYLNTTHGIFYKTVGTGHKGSVVGAGRNSRALLQSTHILLPNSFMEDRVPKDYSLIGVYAGSYNMTGYPRVDTTVNISKKKKSELQKELNLNADNKTILYAPTWRGTKFNREFDIDRLLTDLQQIASLGANIIFMGHPKTEKMLADVNIPGVIIPKGHFVTNEILGIVDIVISDYSSVFFDFIVTKKPIVHYLYDLEEYSRDRGLNLSVDELPGRVAYDTHQLIEALKDSLSNKAMESEGINRVEESIKRFSTYDDGKASKRAVEWFFDSVDYKVNDTAEESLLVFAGKFGHGVKEVELVNKVNNLMAEGGQATVLFKASARNSPKTVALIKKLDKDVNILAYGGKVVSSARESLLLDYYEKQPSSISAYTRKEINNIYKREFKRLFGDSKFNEIVVHDTKVKLWDDLARSQHYGKKSQSR